MIQGCRWLSLAQMIRCWWLSSKALAVLVVHPWSEASARLLESLVDSLGNVVAAVENEEGSLELEAVASWWANGYGQFIRDFLYREVMIMVVKLINDICYQPRKMGILTNKATVLGG